MSEKYLATITRLLADLKHGGEEAKRRALDQLSAVYFTRLCEVAGAKLTSKARRVSDPTDIVNSVFLAIHRRAKAGNFPDLTDRGQFWGLMLMIAHCKTVDRNRRAECDIRGGITIPVDLTEEIISREPTPELVAVFEELIIGLSDPKLIKIVRMKLEGYSVEEVASENGISVRSVQRKIKAIRSQFEMILDKWIVGA